MTALVEALDNYTPTQLGENGHVEYGWSNSIQEQILQFSFQVTRTNNIGMASLESKLTQLLTVLKSRDKTPEGAKYLDILFKIIAHTRDIIDGKGEYNLAYMMVYVWYKFYPELARLALTCFVTLPENMHQYGSWKDLKHFCNYCKDHGEDVTHPLIQHSIQLINDQLRTDLQNMQKKEKVSLASKWAPREKSRFGWLYDELSRQYFNDIWITAITKEQKNSALLKCKMNYRKLLSSLNVYLDTLQIKQCSHSWNSIDFNNVTSISLSKYNKAFLNIRNNGSIRCPDDEDRKQCASNFTEHVNRAKTGEIEMKGKRIGMVDFVKQALSAGTPVEKELVNSQWRDNSTQTGSLGKMIAMVDVSGSMSGDPMNVAIALGIRIAEKSLLGKRVMTFSKKPTWVNLESYSDFTDQVLTVKGAEWGMNTNFHAALDLILDAIVKNKMSATDVQDMVLVILSDMQMDAGDSCNKDALYYTMKKKYADAGIKINGVPYLPPHILFWNLKSTSGFPSLSSQTNTSMMSGFSPALLNLFCDTGIEGLQSCTPWSLLMKSLSNPRYQPMVV